ncbi:alpha-glucan family phosphorylase [Agromyces atrinae]|uniref:glycogen phosphorylase n=1 Tax=Agromyces atrinae TaxID=592376 RepID=A0A4Q2M5I3_9MICO|nr:alpha-glucan family phosphorylase [Agromyces atrinae]NYD66537.1 starch phosphorylase [Agromyces atrinae]RXZ87209.1 glycosyltransferase family 1 protein [Agromyces atrinae]
MKAIRKFTVRAVVPEPLAALEDLAANLRWSWHEPTRRLFEHIDATLWNDVGHDPVALLGEVHQDRLSALAADESFIAWTTRERDALAAYLSEPRWFQHLEGQKPRGIAYFSPEFGIAAALPQYSGGLGILAGDHLKSASDLGVPLTGVGLFYRSGYFTQAISPDGWQLESYPLLDPDGLPLSVLRHPDGSAVHVTLALPDDRELHARVWQAAVGRVTLLLLDTDIPENEDDLRSVTDRLYGGGGEHRLLQELLLGIGGVRAVDQWVEVTGAPSPDVFHTNEGHAGFLGLERISGLIGEGLSFDEALQIVRAGTVFTTHTPVPAGIDRFDRALIERYFATDLLPGVEPADVLTLGVEPGGDANVFNMAYMGLRIGQHANGVSKLHGEVSRRMFGALWPGFDSEEVPIGSITNGVHAPTWTDPALLELAESRLGTSDTTSADWHSDAISDGELWSVKLRMREQLVDDARRRLRDSWIGQHEGGTPPVWMDELLDPNVLTIGFARRVPTYKRLTLMLQDPERLAALLTHPERPIQIIIAGKSHPADDEGKRLIQRLVQFTQDPAVRRRIVFLPDYDIGMAQLLYPGCDVWLNNPLRPLEACGTSGMKAALNGALNLSILDGWWAEYFDGENGWAIPTADAAGDDAERDRLEAAALYDLLEHRIAPLYYERDEPTGASAGWMRLVRHTLATLSPELSADRMVRDYVEHLYRPASEYAAKMADAGFRAARDLAAWKQRVVGAWPGVQVVHVESGGVAAVPYVGEELHLRAHVELAGLDPADVTVEVVYGRSRSTDELVDVRRGELTAHGDPGEGARLYTGTVPLDRAGSFGYTVRVVPRNRLLVSPAELGLQTIAS